MSLCQTSSPSPKPPIATPFSMTFETTVTSGCASGPPPCFARPSFATGLRALQLAEAPAERDQVGVAQVLAAEENDLALEPHFADRVDRGVVHGVESAAANFRAERAPRRNDVESRHPLYADKSCDQLRVSMMSFSSRRKAAA
jgi:hypothetical protein